MKAYHVTLTATAYVSASVIVEVEDEVVDADGFSPDSFYIEDLALQQAFDGDVTWEYEGVDNDDIQVGTIIRTWSE